jgi:DNA invertase Pin-like site-specific DNA recombinase
MPGQAVGYIRVSSLDQNTDRQLDGHQLDRIFTDRMSGKDTDRPELESMIRYVRDGAPSSCTRWTGSLATSTTSAAWCGS